MQGKFIDLVYGIVINLKWRYLVILFLVSFFGGWAAVEHFEPHASITAPSVYWWYFVNDVMRGGYSGYSPTTIGGRLTSLASFFGGGLFFLSTVCKSLAVIHEKLQLKKKGLVKLKMKNHIVLLGFRERETLDLIRQLVADRAGNHSIVLVTRHATENPLPGLVEFIHGDTSDDDVLERACVSSAKVIVVSGHEVDERTMAVTIVANSKASKDAHIVVYLEKHENARFIKAVNPRIECVTSLRSSLIAQAVLNPGSTRLIRELVSTNHPGTNFRIDIPSFVQPIQFAQLLTVFNAEYQAIAIGYTVDQSCESFPVLNPPSDAVIRGGMSLFYIAEHRIDEVVDWHILDPVPDTVN